MGPTSHTRNILIVKLAALGDVARASTLLTRIGLEFPHARVTWVVATGGVPLVRMMAGIDRVIEVDEQRLFRGSLVARFLEVAKTWLRLAGDRYDIAVLGHADPRYRWILRMVRAGRVSVLKPYEETGDSFFGDEYAGLLGSGTAPAGAYPMLDLRDAASGVVLPVSAARAVVGSPFVLLVPGGAKNVLRDDPLRRWPLASYAALARGLAASGIRVGIGGGADDGWVREAFAAGEVIDLVGKLDLAQTLRVMSAAATVVTHDTGPLHFAHLVRARVVALFGPTVPARVIGAPERTTILWGGGHLACRPCYDGRDYAPCTRNLCMEDLTVDRVLAATIRSVDEWSRERGHPISSTS